MCGILVYSKAYKEYFSSSRKYKNYPDYYLRKRGPDATNELNIGELIFRHYHLKISRNAKTQPLLQDDCIALFNGEIYNGAYIDGDNIIPSYNEKGVDYTNQLDGEFAISLYDTKQRELLISTDPFGTKPLYFSISPQGIIVSSYKSVINHIGEKARRVAANTTIKIDTETYTIKNIYHPHEWKPNKRNTTLDEWCENFDEAMKKRIYSATSTLAHISAEISAQILA